jgi:transcription termination factor NusB
MQVLNRQEIEDYVIDLYHNQKKTFREIQKIVRKSPRDIRAILDKVEPERASLSTSSRAYKMFMEGSTPVQVAITLGLRENQANEYYREYWNLNGMYHLNQIYEEIKYGIWPVIELHRRMKSEGLSPQQVSRILKTTITLEHKNRDLEGEQARLEVGNKQAATTFQQFTDLIQKNHKTMEENFSVISQQKREIENLNMERAMLENILCSIRLNNETCINIKQIVKQEIENVISNPRKLLKMALASLFESSRKHPGKFQTLYYNMLSHLSVEQILSESSNSQDASLYGFGEDENEKLLLDEAVHSFNRIVNAITNNCINKMSSDTKSPSQIPDIQGGLLLVKDSRKIFDTRELSQINLVYNDITLQINSDTIFSCEQSSKDELDNARI